MEIQSTINFLIGSLLFSVGVIIISCMVVAVNNIFSRFWKPVKWSLMQPIEYRFIDPETMDQVLPNKNVKNTRATRQRS
jgi:hypothetical protein